MTAKTETNVRAEQGVRPCQNKQSISDARTFIRGRLAVDKKLVNAIITRVIDAVWSTVCFNQGPDSI